MDNQLLIRGTSSSSSTLGKQIGRTFCFDDLDMDNPPNRRSHHQVHVRLVQNNSGIALLPKRLVIFEAGTNRTKVDGYANDQDDGASVVAVDEWLPSTGVPNGEYFYVVCKGPAMLTTSPAANGENVITEDDIMSALTGAASTVSTTSGRVISTVTTGATGPLAGNILGAFGRAMSAKTTANSDADVLVFMSNRWD